MALKIRLRQQGRNNKHTYRLVVTDSRTRRDGKYVEMLGWYDPAKTENDALVQADRVVHWLTCGAELSDNVRALLARTTPDVVKWHEERKRQKRLKECARRRAKA